MGFLPGAIPVTPLTDCYLLTDLEVIHLWSTLSTSLSRLPVSCQCCLFQSLTPALCCYFSWLAGQGTSMSNCGHSVHLVTHSTKTTPLQYTGPIPLWVTSCPLLIPVLPPCFKGVWWCWLLLLCHMSLNSSHPVPSRRSHLSYNRCEWGTI